MNFQHFIGQEQSFANVKTSLLGKQIIVKEQDDSLDTTKKIALLTYPNVSHRNDKNCPDMDDPLIRSCRGVIVQEEPLKVLAYTFSKPRDGRTSLAKGDVNLDITQFNVEELIDGSFIKLFYHNSMWNVSTHRCINSKKAIFNNYKSFYDMWMEAKTNSGLNYDDLSTSNTYSFVLCHPENRIVANYQTSYIIHVGTFDMTQNKEIDVTISNVQKPTSFIFSTYNELITDLNKCGHQTRGFMVKSKEINENGEYDRYIFESDEYKKVKSVRGDNRSMIYRYIYLSRTDPVTFQEFKTYFPEFSWIDTHFEQLSQLIHWLYMSFYVNKTTKFINPKYWELTNELHTLYLRTNQPTTIHTVRNHLNSYPINDLCLLLNGKVPHFDPNQLNQFPQSENQQLQNQQS